MQKRLIAREEVKGGGTQMGFPWWRGAAELGEQAVHGGEHAQELLWKEGR